MCGGALIRCHGSCSLLALLLLHSMDIKFASVRLLNVLIVKMGKRLSAGGTPLLEKEEREGGFQLEKELKKTEAETAFKLHQLELISSGPAQASTFTMFQSLTQVSFFNCI